MMAWDFQWLVLKIRIVFGSNSGTKVYAEAYK